MTDVSPAEGAATVAVPAQRRPPQPPPEGRGRTEVADQVVLKIACVAAEELPEVHEVRVRTAPWSRSPGATRPWGRTSGGMAPGRSSGAEVRGGRATIRLHVVVAYPAPLRAVAARLREHVRRRVADQTGLEVTRLDVIVTDLDGGPR
ncbi:Asp23/Gls24 family envelope stress response protein [Nonomuraea sp. KC401]|uniref:Asp23/Gls24 family envelope stress response protein n=1 Tax=unclassified Nonomuraea TaxID=2593643 RepID=UPI0010FEF287|nr:MULTISPECIES: Asp23/Gls24 family envelope stress response protein [unclassified Nonomuraea]NBE96098.1 Asp23/Gls24 family envelope stress response protein [Nonomuraea sp. K271]TLF80296.1 Asp23/Gls24 family envelope stress response protein [Nonomuraea sp. KC401]